MKLFQNLISFITNEGAEYADIRVHTFDLTESITIMNKDVEHYQFEEKSGYGIRVLYNGAWGFVSGEDITSFSQMKKDALKAIENAKNASVLSKYKIQFYDKSKIISSYSTPTKIDPFDLDLSEKINHLMKINSSLYDPRFEFYQVSVNFYKKEILYFDTLGSEIKKNILDVHGSMEITAKDNEDMIQTRSFELYQLSNGTIGWENILSNTQFDQSQRIKDELIQLLDAPKCKEEITDIILLPEMMALQTHETIGHALELDRILGHELSYAGGSHVTLDDFNTMKFGTPKLTARANGLSTASPGSTGFDDDRVPATNTVLIENGILKNSISSVQMTKEANNHANKVIFKKSSACSRAQSFDCMPIDRMSNINIDHGTDGDLEELIASCKNGLLIETPMSWSIGSSRENFHFAAQIAWKIIDGKISNVIRNPSYMGDSLTFWSSLSKVGNKNTWQMQQVFNCGKGQPNQVMRLGHGVPACLFTNIQVGK